MPPSTAAPIVFFFFLLGADAAAAARAAPLRAAIDRGLAPLQSRGLPELQKAAEDEEEEASIEMEKKRAIVAALDKLFSFSSFDDFVWPSGFFSLFIHLPFFFRFRSPETTTPVRLLPSPTFRVFSQPNPPLVCFDRGSRPAW